MSTKTRLWLVAFLCALLAIMPGLAQRTASPKRQAAQSEKELKAAIREAEDFVPLDRRLPHRLDALAEFYLDQGKYSKAEPLYERSLALREKLLGPRHLDVARSLDNLAYTYTAQRKYAKAEAIQQRSREIRQKALAAHPDVYLDRSLEVVESLDHLAELYVAEGKYAEAEPLYQQALAIREKVLGPSHIDVARNLKNYAALLRKANREAEAEKMELRAKTIEANRQ